MKISYINHISFSLFHTNTHSDSHLYLWWWLPCKKNESNNNNNNHEKKWNWNDKRIMIPIWIDHQFLSFFFFWKKPFSVDSFVMLVPDFYFRQLHTHTQKHYNRTIILWNFKMVLFLDYLWWDFFFISFGLSNNIENKLYLFVVIIILNF